MQFTTYVVQPFIRMLLGLFCSMNRQDRNTAHGAHDAGVTCKIPPAWAPEWERTFSFNQYVQELNLWAAATDIDQARIAPTVALRLQGSAKLVTREMDPAMLQNGVMIANPLYGMQQGEPQQIQISGLEYLIRQLRRRYAPLQQEVQISSISDLFHFRRHSSENTDELIARFELCIHRAANLGQVIIGEAICAWMMLSALGIPRDKWAMLLAPTVGALPNTAPEYADFVSYLRRNGHLYDGTRDKSIQQPFFGQSVQNYHQGQSYEAAAQWPYPEQEQTVDIWNAYPATSAQVDEEWELSSGQSNDEEPVNYDDVAHLPAPQAGEQIYLGYRTAKRRFRKFTKAPGRSGKGKGRKGGKGAGKGFKSKSRPAFWAADGSPIYAESPNGFSTWEDDSWVQEQPPAYAFQKGAEGKGNKGKRRGNPIGPDGKVMQCSLCQSEEHFQRFCPQGKGKGKSSASGFVEIPVPHWTQQMGLPGGGVYFQNPAVQDSFSASIEYADGSSEPLESTTALFQRRLDESAASEPISATSRQPQSIPDHLQKLWSFPWWAYHTSVRLSNGKEGLLIDCGAIDHMMGSRVAKRMIKAAELAGQGSAWDEISPISVEGVGEGASTVSRQVRVPLCLSDGQHGEYKAIVVGSDSKESDLPALYGMSGLRKQAAVIDTGNNRLIFPGAGGIKYILSPGTRVHKLEIAVSGHLMLPCCEWHAAKAGTSSASAAGPALL